MGKQHSNHYKLLIKRNAITSTCTLNQIANETHITLQQVFFFAIATCQSPALDLQILGFIVENSEADAVSHGGGVLLSIACKYGVDNDTQFPVGGARLPITGVSCGSVTRPRLPWGQGVVSSKMGTRAPGAPPVEIAADSDAPGASPVEIAAGPRKRWVWML
jgi:hypothetical protein